VSGTGRGPPGGDWVAPTIIERRPDPRGAALAGLQLHCRVGDHELEMLVQGSGDGMRILGLAILGKQPAAQLEIELFDGATGRPAQAVTTNAFGQFDLHAPAGERWALRVGSDPDSPRVRLWEVLGS